MDSGNAGRGDEWPEGKNKLPVLRDGQEESGSGALEGGRCRPGSLALGENCL